MGFIILMVFVTGSCRPRCVASDLRFNHEAIILCVLRTIYIKRNRNHYHMESNIAGDRILPELHRPNHPAGWRASTKAPKRHLWKSLSQRCWIPLALTPALLPDIHRLSFNDQQRNHSMACPEKGEGPRAQDHWQCPSVSHLDVIQRDP